MSDFAFDLLVFIAPLAVGLITVILALKFTQYRVAAFLLFFIDVACVFAIGYGRLSDDPKTWLWYFMLEVAAAVLAFLAIYTQKRRLFWAAFVLSLVSPVFVYVPTVLFIFTFHGL